MRLILMVILPVFASPAFAVMDPGLPPWYCRPFSACDGTGKCTSIEISLPMGFKLRREGTERDRFVLEGLYGQKSAATMFRTLEEARKNVEAARSGDRIGVILVPNDLISDNHGFWMYTARRGMEGYSLHAASGDRLWSATSRVRRWKLACEIETIKRDYRSDAKQPLRVFNPDVSVTCTRFPKRS